MAEPKQEGEEEGVSAADPDLPAPRMPFDLDPDIGMIRRRTLAGGLILVSVVAGLWRLDLYESGGGLDLMAIGIFAPAAFIMIKALIVPARFRHLGLPRLSTEILEADGPPLRFLRGVENERDTAIVCDELISQLEPPKSSRWGTRLSNGFLGLLAVFWVVMMGTLLGGGLMNQIWLDVLGAAMALGGSGVAIRALRKQMSGDKQALELLRDRRAELGAATSAEQIPAPPEPATDPTP